MTSIDQLQVEKSFVLFFKTIVFNALIPNILLSRLSDEQKCIFSHLKSVDFETVCDWSTSSWRNNLDTPWCNNLVCNDLDDVITLWRDVKIVTPQGHVLFTAFGKLMFEYIFWYEVNQWFLNDSPEILENYGLSKHDKFSRRATGQFRPDIKITIVLSLELVKTYRLLFPLIDALRNFRVSRVSRVELPAPRWGHILPLSRIFAITWKLCKISSPHF